jgi:hypothetical protein
VAPYSYCALTDSAGEPVCAGFADENGNVTLKFAPMREHATYEFAAWAQKYVQYFKTVYSGYLGIEELGITNYELRIYPNPTTGELRIQMNKNTCERVNEIEIFDMYGKNVGLQKFPSFEEEGVVDISHLSAGTYFIKIKTLKKTCTQKIIKL